MIITVDTSSPVPPYEQIRAQVTSHATEGDLQPGDRLPTVRQLAKDLGIAVNTVARAYRELEHAGVVVSRGRHGTFVTPRAPDSTDRANRLDRAARAYVGTANELGLSRSDAVQLVEQLWPTAADHP